MRNVFQAIIMAALVLFTGACSQQEQISLPKGNISFTIAEASNLATQHTGTRATPAELGKPLADKFSLTIMHTGGIQPVYDGKFVETLAIEPGEFDITARCGEDVKIGRDTPYYIGTAQATVRPGKPTAVSIPCRVGNALISVNFGRDAQEKERLNKFYSEYAVTVAVGQESMDITPEQEATSIYFPAGSSPRLTFHGKLKAQQDKEVSFELQSPDLPSQFQAADHGIITITLPDPETSFLVQIGKAEVETVTMQHSIPVSWLPIPEAQATQVFGEDGLYQGTTVTFSDTKSDVKWKAELTNAEGIVVRSVTGTGQLTSDCHTEVDFPCLPGGEYQVTYYMELGGVEKSVTTRSLTIQQPNLSLTVDGYTSYTRYLAGDIDGANNCDAYTVYAPSASINVSEELLAKCQYTFSVSYEGQEHTLPGKRSIALDNQTNTKANLTPYVLIAKASIAGINLEKTREFFITGLPCGHTPPTQAGGWVGHGTPVTFKDSQVELGLNAFNGDSQSITNNNFAVPQGTKVELGYHVIVRGGAGGTTLTLSMGQDELFKKTHSAVFGKNYAYQETKVFTVSADATQFTCNNSYGVVQNESIIKSLIFKYAK